MSTSKSNTNRINFPAPVKASVAKSSGGYCSIADCLAPLYARGVGKNGPKGVFLGEIAHIYSAAVNGPGGQGDKSPEFLASEDNAIAVCSSCHTNIDKIRRRYPEDDLFAMKAVRERAQAIALHPIVKHYVSRLGPSRLDELIRGNPTESDEQIVERYIRFGHTAIPLLDLAKQVSAEQSQIIAGVAPLLLFQAIQYAIAGIAPSLDQQSESDLRDRTRALIEHWLADEEGSISANEEIECDFYTKDRYTGAKSESIRLKFDIDLIRRHCSESDWVEAFRIKRLQQKSVGLEWQLYAEAGSEHGHMLKSRLRLNPMVCPDHTEDDQGFRHYAGYARIVREIASGRLPAARLSIHSNRFRLAAHERGEIIDEVMCPLEFKIELADSILQVQQALAATNKIFLAKDIADDLNKQIIFRLPPEAKTPAASGPNDYVRGFFTVELTEPIIRKAILESSQKLASQEHSRRGLILKPVVQVEHEGIPHHVRPYCTENNIRFRLESASVFRE
ncbi:hypothetical protein [Pseudomonas urmiensis]|uniref:hypothetical protein n=1 Tax=Pseudomonas urmiensis TaxID=2745493 RepID=UPI003D0997C0